MCFNMVCTLYTRSINEGDKGGNMWQLTREDGGREGKVITQSIGSQLTVGECNAIEATCCNKQTKQRHFKKQSRKQTENSFSL